MTFAAGGFFTGKGDARRVAKASDEMVEVRNVNVPGYRGRVNRQKYEAMRRVLLAALPSAGPG